MFDLEQALAENSRLTAQRAKTRSTAYVLYYSNNGKQAEGKITGFTIKQLINEFRASKGAYKFAFITKINGDTLLRSYNAMNGKAFISHTRTGKRRKA